MRKLLATALLMVGGACPVLAQFTHDLIDPVTIRGTDGTLYTRPTTAQKPQSKVWLHDGDWFSVLPSPVGAAADQGSWLWRLDGSSWVKIRKLSDDVLTEADALAVGDVAHVLLFNREFSQLVSLEYEAATRSYVPWTERPASVTLPIPSSAETATLDIDTVGRMWMCYDRRIDGERSIEVKYSDRNSDYGSWSASRYLLKAGDVASPPTAGDPLVDPPAGDDLCGLIAFDGKIGVLWSNQNTEAFEFRYHVDGQSSSQWSAREVIDHSFYEAEQGMPVPGVSAIADDHINLAAASDGTLYAAVKTEYNGGGFPDLGLLRRGADGVWSFHTVATDGTRPIVLLNEAEDDLVVFYTHLSGGGNSIDLRYKQAPSTTLDFGDPDTYERMLAGNYFDVSSTKQTFGDEVVILVTEYLNDAAVGVRASPFVPSQDAVACWEFEEANGSIAFDSSANGNDGTLEGTPVRDSGYNGTGGISLDGLTDFVEIPDDPSLDITTEITMAAWVRPEKVEVQRIIFKVDTGANTGYHMGLTGGGGLTARFNNNTTYQAFSNGTHPTDGTTWMHVAATYDGAAIRLYLDGELSNSKDLVFTIETNDLPMRLGAQPQGNFAGFQGGLDDVKIYDRALSASEIRDLAASAPGVSLTVQLQGGMTTALKNADEIPGPHPFEGSPWFYDGTETLLAAPDRMVDWVLVHLRSDPDNPVAVAQRAAALLEDGNVVDLDGVSEVTFPDLAPGDYYVVVYHRNHLATISREPVPINR